MRKRDATEAELEEAEHRKRVIMPGYFEQEDEEEEEEEEGWGGVGGEEGGGQGGGGGAGVEGEGDDRMEDA